MATRRTYAGRHSAARLISGVGALFALIEAVYVLLNLFGANQGNGFYKFVESLAGPLAVFFPGLFAISSHVWYMIVTYGLAALFWLVVTGVVARIVAR